MYSAGRRSFSLDFMYPNVPYAESYQAVEANKIPECFDTALHIFFTLSSPKGNVICCFQKKALQQWKCTFVDEFLLVVFSICSVCEFCSFCTLGWMFEVDVSFLWYWSYSALYLQAHGHFPDMQVFFRCRTRKQERKFLQKLLSCLQCNFNWVSPRINPQSTADKLPSSWPLFLMLWQLYEGWKGVAPLASRANHLQWLVGSRFDSHSRLAWTCEQWNNGNNVDIANSAKFTAVQGTIWTGE